ncbi:MAG: hypothetical protein P8P83_03080 [Rickettsiaceae bacterium]|nr:hypothetical protein [Rickettsiaceae bacterium]
MMHIISQRVNTIKDLSRVDYTHGIEIDIRYHDDDLILYHDPFHTKDDSPEKFEDLLAEYVKNHTGTIILNIKTEGVESRCISLMNKYNYTNWFFLDLSMPYFVIYSNKAASKEIAGFTPDNLAVRFSEFEPIEYALSFEGKVRWVWVDCFTKMPLTQDNARKLKDANFKLCLVAPELQKHDIDRAVEFQKILQNNNIKLDAVCTKKPELWKTK